MTDDTDKTDNVVFISFGPLINEDGTPGKGTIAMAREMGTLDQLHEMFPNWVDPDDDGTVQA